MTVTLFSQGSQLAAGRYVLESRLGSGGMATVWLARDTRLARKVAIKLPSEALTADETFTLRFEREAQTAAALTHPNLVSVYDYGTEGERPYLVSEYVDGANLAELRARYDAPRTEVLAKALLDALAHIHAAGIVHRDVKPGNVLVDSGQRILLTDFGIAQSTEGSSLTATGHVVGTPSYLAPEVKRGGRADPRSDLYATGVLLAEQLTHGDPDRVARLVDALTEQDPAARPRSAEQALELLERRPVVVTEAVPVVEDEPEPEPVIRPDYRPPPTPPRGFPLPPAQEGPRGVPLAAIAGALLAALVVVAVVLAFVLNGGDDSGSPGTAEPAASPGKSGGSNQAAAESTAAEATTEAAPTTTATETTTVPETTATTPAATGLPAPDPNPDPDRGFQLNAQGKQLLDSGDAAGAVPILEQAVAAYPADASDLNYGYALFNYAQALRLSGNPEAAIPVLERRLQIPDQLDAVNAELKAAKKAAKGK